MKKILLFFMLLFSSVMVVDANSISNIDMDIFVDIYGNATVVETWDAYVNQGTEGWHPYYNLGSSEISDLEVTMDGKKFTTVSNWNVDSSLETKAYKAGIYYVNNSEVDICFGITSYGSHKYVIQYKISNFVSTVEDADMIYWNLFPHDFSAGPSNVDITIYSDFKYEDTLDVWGYGKYGAPCYVYDGKIEMTSDNSTITSDEYMTILVKFPKGTFQTSSVLDKDFNYYYEIAEDGAVNFSDKISFFDFIKDKMIIFLPIILLLIFFVIFSLFGIRKILTPILSKINVISKKKHNNNLKVDVLIYREIPCNNDLVFAYWLATSYGLSINKEDFFGAILLKWIKDNNVRLETKASDKTLEKDINNIIFVKRPDDELRMECRLYDYMQNASKDGILGNNEFNDWCSKNYSKILGWFSDVYYFETMQLMKNGNVHYKKNMNMQVFNINYFDLDSSLKEESEKLFGLKRFLEEFTLINKREPIEVKLWKEYLVFAQLFGIADEVSKQFEKLYPEIKEDMNVIWNYRDINFISTLVVNSFDCANKAQVSYNRKNNNFSRSSQATSYGSSGSGGGGFSSGGGGRGSFGSGSGGGGFR